MLKLSHSDAFMWLLARRGRIRDSTKRPFFSLQLLYNATDALQGLTTPARHAHYLLEPGRVYVTAHFTV